MTSLRFLILLLFFMGLSFMVMGYVKSKSFCPPPKIEYRYIPRTFLEEQEAPTLPSEIFRDMFTKPTPFVGGFSIGNIGPSRNNAGYITQG